MKDWRECQVSFDDDDDDERKLKISDFEAILFQINQRIFKVPVRFPLKVELTPKLDSIHTLKPQQAFLHGKECFYAHSRDQAETTEKVLYHK